MNIINHGKINKHNQFSALNDVKGFFQKNSIVLYRVLLHWLRSIMNIFMFCRRSYEINLILVHTWVWLLQSEPGKAARMVHSIRKIHLRSEFGLPYLITWFVCFVFIVPRLILNSLSYLFFMYICNILIYMLSFLRFITVFHLTPCPPVVSSVWLQFDYRIAVLQFVPSSFSIGSLALLCFDFPNDASLSGVQAASNGDLLPPVGRGSPWPKNCTCS